MSNLLRLVALALAAAAGLGIVFGFAGRSHADPVLTGDVGLNEAFTITLVDANGAPVTHLNPGNYTIVVHDHSTIHNFHLLGPGVDVATPVETVGDTTWSVTLADGNYTYVCDPHAAGGMKGAFGVGTAPAPTTTTTTTTTQKPPPKPAPAKVSAHVGPGASIGVTAVRLTAGKAVVTVADRSRADNFHLVGPGVNRSTGVVFRGTVRWALTLRAGTYTFRSDAHQRLRGSFVVRAAR